MKINSKTYLILFILLLSGCYSVNEISTYKELGDARRDGEIQIVMRDSTVFYVDKFTYSDSSINIRGFKKKSNSNKSWNSKGAENYQAYPGQIPFKCEIFSLFGNIRKCQDQQGNCYYGKSSQNGCESCGNS